MGSYVIIFYHGFSRSYTESLTRLSAVIKKTLWQRPADRQKERHCQSNSHISPSWKKGRIDINQLNKPIGSIKNTQSTQKTNKPRKLKWLPSFPVRMNLDKI
jgi:hypothetical protein